MPSYNVAIIGAGNISSAYLRGCRLFPILKLCSIADLDASKAQQQAEAFGIRALHPDEVLADPDIDIVVNLTPPQAHATLSRAALEAGKHVYSEKPLAIDVAQGQALVELAEAKGLYLGCAPDTFLGGGLQTCRKVLDEGMIGTPVAAQAFFVTSGPERWHPDPAFFYQQGAGPLFDIGPYLITSLVHFFGSVKRVTGQAKTSFSKRYVHSGAKQGTMIDVETATHITGLLDFVNGSSASITTSFDVPAHQLPHIEIYGSEGTLSTPDPNTFAGPVRVRRFGDDAWQDIPLRYGYTDNSRGLGVADMAYAMYRGRPTRASGRQALHTLEVMATILASAEQGMRLELKSHTERPAVLPEGMPQGVLDG